MNFAPPKPAVVAAKTDDDDEMLSFFDPAIGYVKAKDYCKALHAASKRRRRHYTNPIFHRPQKDFWIDGQNALRIASYWVKKPFNMGNWMFAQDDDWLPDEYVQYNDRQEKKTADAWLRWQAWSRKRLAMKGKVNSNLATNTSTKYYKKEKSAYPGRIIITPKFDIEARMRAKELGRARAEKYGVILKFKKTAPATADEHAWDLRFCNGMELARCPQLDRWFLEKHFPHVYHARLPESSKVRSLVRILQWIPDFQAGRLGTREMEMVEAAAHKTASHFLHQSVDEPVMVAYAPSYAYFKADRWIRTTFGRYMTKFFGHVLNEKQIREAANRWTIAMTPPTLHFVGNDDPAKWEWVYENSPSFKSCMTANRTDRYISGEVLKIMHPVRLYANKRNNLALAWLGVDDKNGVAARCIVDTVRKFYLRVYGDDRLRIMLHKEGYSENRSHTLVGAVFDAVRLYPDQKGNNTFIAPYLDGGAVRHERIDGQPYLRIVDSFPCYTPNSNAIVVVVITVRKECSCCTQTLDVPEGDEYGDGRLYRFLDYDICNVCMRMENYIYAWVNQHDQDWIPETQAYYDNYNDRHLLKDPEAMRSMNMIELKGAWRHKDELVFLPVDNVYADRNDIYSLNFTIYRDGQAQKVTLKQNAAKDVNGDWYDVRYSATCAITGFKSSEAQFFFFGPDNMAIHRRLFFYTSRECVAASRRFTVTDIVDNGGENITATVVMHDTPQSENLLTQFLSEYFYVDGKVVQLRNFDMIKVIKNVGLSDIRWCIQGHHQHVLSAITVEKRNAAAKKAA